MANGTGYFPPGRGGNDPARQAAIQQLGRIPTSRPDVQAQAPPMMPPQQQPGLATGPLMEQQMGGPAGGVQGGNPQLGNEVAFHLSNAFQALVKSPPSMESLSAVKQFVQSVVQLHSGQGQQGQGGQAAMQQQPPMGGGPPQQMGGPPQQIGGMPPQGQPPPMM